MFYPSAISVTETDEYYIWILENKIKNVGSCGRKRKSKKIRPCDLKYMHEYWNMQLSYHVTFMIRF